MSTQFFFPQHRVLTANIKAGAGWELHFFKPGTTTRKDTYKDESLSTPHNNPVVADADGEFPVIWAEGRYKVELRDSSGSTQNTIDPYQFPSDLVRSNIQDSLVRQVNSISTLRSTSFESDIELVYVQGYNGIGTPGGGHLYRSSGSDNGVTKFADADGVIWERDFVDREVTPEMAGATRSGDDHAALQRLLDHLEQIDRPIIKLLGKYQSSDTLLKEGYTGDVAIHGEGVGEIQFTFSVTASINGLNFKGDSTNGAGTFVLDGVTFQYDRDSGDHVSVQMVHVHDFRHVWCTNNRVWQSDNMAIKIEAFATGVMQSLIVHGNVIGGKSGTHANNSVAGTGFFLSRIAQARTIVTNNTVRNTGDDGIFVDAEASVNPREVLIQGNQMFEVGGKGIAFTVPNACVANNYLDRTQADGIRAFKDAGGAVPDEAYITDNVIIEGGQFEGGASDSISNGINFSDGAGIVVARNEIFNPRIRGVKIGDTDGNRVHDNFVQGAGGSAGEGSIEKGGTGAVNDLRIERNTILDGEGWAIKWFTNTSNSSDGVHILDNRIRNTENSGTNEGVIRAADFGSGVTTTLRVLRNHVTQRTKPLLNTNIADKVVDHRDDEMEGFPFHSAVISLSNHLRVGDNLRGRGSIGSNGTLLLLDGTKTWYAIAWADDTAGVGAYWHGIWDSEDKTVTTIASATGANSTGFNPANDGNGDFDLKAKGSMGNSFIAACIVWSVDTEDLIS